MTSQRRVAVAVDGSASPESIMRLFGDSGIATAAVVPARAISAEQLSDRNIDGIVVVCERPDVQIVDFVRAATAARPWLPIVLACRPDSGESLADALASGADELIALTGDAENDRAVAQQLRFALEKAIAVRNGAASDSRGGRPGEVITIIGPKGGTGKTLTTCNLGVTLALAGKRVVLVDLDLQFGDVGLALGLEPVRTFAELAAAPGVLDAAKINDYLVEHESGVRCLLAPMRPDEAAAVNPDLVRVVLNELKMMADVVIVDTPPGFTPEVITAVDQSSALCIVAMLDSLSLKNTRLALDTLDLMGTDDHVKQLVLNRADSSVGVEPSDVEALIGRWPDVLVPSSRDIARTVNEATPIVMVEPSSAAAQAFAALARAFVPDIGEVEGLESGRTRRSRRRLRRSAKAAKASKAPKASNAPAAA